MLQTAQKKTPSPNQNNPRFVFADGISHTHRSFSRFGLHPASLFALCSSMVTSTQLPHVADEKPFFFPAKITHGSLLQTVYSTATAGEGVVHWWRVIDAGYGADRWVARDPQDTWPAPTSFGDGRAGPLLGGQVTASGPRRRALASIEGIWDAPGPSEPVCRSAGSGRARSTKKLDSTCSWERLLGAPTEC